MVTPHLSHAEEPWRPGSWEPGRLGLLDSIVLTAVLTLAALVRAWDYATPDLRPTPIIPVIEQAFPLPVWGAMFGVPALILAVSAILRVHAGVWVGHWALAVVYIGLCIGMGGEYISRPWGDGIRSATVLIPIITIHVLIATRMGWRPPRWSPRS